MVTITFTYDGELGTTAIHGPSGTALRTDAPLDNAGRGLSFSPTDLLATSLGTCVLTTMAIVAQRLGISFEPSRGRVVKTMTTTGPRRVEALDVEIQLPASVPDTDRERLETAGRRCPVAMSLHPDVRLNLVFQWTA